MRFMTKVTLHGLLAALLLALAAVLPLRAADTPPDNPPTDGPSHPYAVLIGVSQYGDKQIKPRPHAEEDVKALYDLVTDKGYLGVAQDHVRLLLGSSDPQRHSQPATRENILKALQWVASQAGRDDVVILAFVGEGAPLSDAAGRLCYFACDSNLKGRSKNAVAAADIQQELDKLKSQRFCAFVDVDFHGFENGPEAMPEPTLGTFPYREFRGTEGKEDQMPAPGRVVFLATNGLTTSIDVKEHGLFAQTVLDGLKGGADREGFEPDGVVTVDELVEYIDKELPERARQFGKTDEQKRQLTHVLESRASHFVLVHNPAVMAKVEARLAKLAALAKEHKVSAEHAAEGEKLLARMPKLKAYQDLRREYEKLVDGTLDAEQFPTQRADILAGTKLKRSTAFAYAAKVIQATQVIRDAYVKEVNQGDMIAWAVRGLYRQIDEKMPSEVKDRLDKAKDLSEAELTALLADVRERLGKREDLDNHKDIDFSLQRMLAHLDPYTTYIDPETLSRFTTETTGKFKGIGIQIRENRTRGLLQCITPLKGSPAYRAGLKAGDWITHITREVDSDGTPLAQPQVTSTKGLTTNDAVKLIQGKPGTKIKLTVQRDGEDRPLEFEITRAEIEVESIMGFQRQNNDEWDYTIDPANKICYIRVTSFARNTYRDIYNVVRKLDKKGINGLILDLRFNPGGLLTSAVEISDLFIDDGVIVKIKPRVGREATYTGEHENSFLGFPMVCLVNGMSASGSEIVSACLQDHRRAVIMGERSYGKGSVQNIQPFEGGELKLTTASFWRPNGKNLNKSSTTGKEDDDWGVRPTKGYLLNLTEHDREQLYEHLRDAEIIPRRDAPPPKVKKPDFKDRQLEMAIDYLREQIRTADKVTSKRAG
jgi:C-terminal peptidase prc